MFCFTVFTSLFNPVDSAFYPISAHILSHFSANLSTVICIKRKAVLHCPAGRAIMRERRDSAKGRLSPRSDMKYYLLSLLGSTIGSYTNMCVKQYDRRAGHIRSSTALFNLILAAVSTLYFAALSLVSGNGIGLHREVFGCSVLRAAGYVMGVIGYLEAVHRGSLLISIVVSQMGSLIPIIYSVIVYKEPVTLAMAAGMAALFGALLLFYGGSPKAKAAAAAKSDTSDPADRSRPKPFFWLFCAMSSVGNGIAILAAKIQQQAQPGLYREELLFWSMVMVTGVFLVMLLIRPPKVEGEPEDGKPPFRIPVLTGAHWAVLYALGNSTVNYISTITVSKLPAIVFCMIGTGFGIILTVFNTRIIFKEKLAPLQYGGLALAVAGLILLTAF